MAELHEGEPKQAEYWIESESMKDLVDQHMTNTGNNNLECLPQSIMLENVSDRRKDQVNLALQNAVNSKIAHEVRAGNRIALGTVGISMNGSDIAFNFVFSRTENKSQSLKDLDEVLSSANEILETFDQPKLPKFSLQTVVKL